MPNTKFDVDRKYVEQILTDRKMEHKDPKTWKGGLLWKLKQCPFNEQHDAWVASFTLGERGPGFACFQCKKDGEPKNFRDFKTEILGLKAKKQKAYPSLPGLTVAQYCAAKCLDEKWAKEVMHLEDALVPREWSKGQEIPAVWWTYSNGSRKFRWAMGKDTRWFLPGNKAGVYAVEQCEQILKTHGDIDPPNYVGIAEGESDCETLLAYGFPCIAILGKDSVGSFDPTIPLLKNKTLLVFEDRKDGKIFVENVAKKCASLPNLVLRVRLSGKMLYRWIGVNPTDGKLKEFTADVSLDADDISDLWCNKSLDENGKRDPAIFEQKLRVALRNAEAIETERLQEASPKAVAQEVQEQTDEIEENLDLMNTDTLFADRLIGKYGNFIRWCKHAGVFYVFDNAEHIWEEEEQHAGSTMGSYLRDIAENELKDQSDKFRSRAFNVAGQNAAETQVRRNARIAAKITEFDNRPMLLNVVNGTIEMGEKIKKRDFQADDMLTAKCPISYDPKAKCPQYLEALSFAFDGDKDAVHHFIKCQGYCLTGSTMFKDATILLSYGEGDSGKSGLNNIMAGLLGPFYRAADKFSFMIQPQATFEKDPDYEKADLYGSRLAVLSEFAKTEMLNTPLLKECTGGTIIPARKINCPRFSYLPQFKFWMDSNYLPVIKDEILWNRMQVFHFRNHVEEIIPHWPNVILREEGPGILTMLLHEGVIGAFTESLAMPKRFLDDTRVARGSAATRLGKFIEDCMVRDPTNVAWERAGEILDAYVGWCYTTSTPALPSQTIAPMLDLEQLKKKRGATGEVRHGLKFKEFGREMVTLGKSIKNLKEIKI